MQFVTMTCSRCGRRIHFRDNETCVAVGCCEAPDLTITHGRWRRPGGPQIVLPPRPA